MIPCDIEILCSSCFSDCKSCSSISFETDSQFSHIKSYAFSCPSRVGRLLDFSNPNSSARDLSSPAGMAFSEQSPIISVSRAGVQDKRDRASSAESTANV
jgi:hypothetical protein